MSLTPTQFYAYTGLTSSDVNTNYLTYLLSSIDEIITDNIGSLFTLVTIDSTNTDPDFQYMDFQGSNLNLIKIGAWQANDLVIKRGYYPYTSTQTLKTLTLNQDYLLKYYQDRKLYGRVNPVVAIQLLVGKLYPDEFIRVTGIMGWSNGYPADLADLIFELIRSKLFYNETQVSNSGQTISSEKSANLSVTYATDSTSAQSLAKVITSDKEVKILLNKYKQNSLSQISIS
jgi:hypothetical protein